MGELKEFFPVIMGIIVGVLGSRIAVARTRYIVTAVLAIILGTAWSMTVGEFAESPAFALVDIGLVVIAAAITLGIATLVWRRSARQI